MGANAKLLKAIPIIEKQVRVEIGEWLNNWWDRGICGKQNWYEMEAFIQALKDKKGGS